MKKSNKQWKSLLVAGLILINSFTSSVYAVTNTIGSSSKEEIEASQSGQKESDEVPSSLQAEVGTQQSEQSNEKVQPSIKSINPFESDIYFPKEPSEQDVIDAGILPGEIPLAESQKVFGNSGTSYSFAPFLSNANSQIIKYQHANIVTNYKPQFPKFGYAEGIGKPRGIVIHETANPNSTIWNEIAYMSNNYNSAFVQTFADANNIIEIHPTDYAAWGCGPNGNPYFVQIELVEHNNRTDFYKSVNNQAYYAAHILKRYNLTPSRASGGKGNPSGSVWGHFEVSSLLGGTNHSDPVGYFAKNGYSFNEFYELVQYHYNKLNFTIITEEKNVNYSGIVTQQEDVFSKPKTTIEAVKKGSTASYLNKKISVTKIATTNDNQNYYYSPELAGWVTVKSVDLYDKIEYSKDINLLGKMLSLNEVESYNIYDGIFNTVPGVNKIASGSLYADNIVTISKEAKTSRAIWYYFAVDGVNVGWMNSLAFHTYDPVLSQSPLDTKGVMLPVSTVAGYNVYSEIFNTSPTVALLAKAEVYSNKQLKIIQKATTQRATWYQFSIDNKIIGWINSSAIHPYDPILSQTALNLPGEMLSTNAVSGYNVYSDIYNSGPNANLVASAGTYGGQQVKIIQKATTYRATWYQFSIAGKTVGWVNSLAVNPYDPILSQESVSIDGRLLPANSIKGYNIYGGIFNTGPDAKLVAKSEVYGDKKAKIIQKATTYRATWYQFSIDGKIIGWVNSNVFVKYDPILTQDSVYIDSKLLSAQSIAGYNIYSEIYNTGPNGVLVAKSEIYGGKEAKIVQKATTYRATWYQFSIAGKIIGWVNSNVFETYDSIISQEDVNKEGQLLPASSIVGYNVYSEIFNTSPSGKLVAKSDVYGGKVAKILKMAVTYRATWYQFSIAGKTIGWVNANVFVKYDPILSQSSLNSDGKIRTATEISGYNIYSDVFNTSPNAKLVSKSDVYGDKEVKIIQKAVTYRATWYQFSISGKVIGWVNSNVFEAYDPIITQEKIDIDRQLRPANAIVGYNIYDEVFNTSPSGKFVAKSEIYGGQFAKIIQTATTYRATWYQFSINGKIIGWVNALVFGTTPDKFVSDIIKPVKEITQGKDLFASVMMAQAILESSYGNSKLGGAPNNNLFGIKGNYKGASIKSETKEFDSVSQKWLTIIQEFKKYPSHKESFADNADKILNGTTWDKLYYHGAWKSVAKNYQNATQALTGKYATDPDYGKKLNKIIIEWNLTQYD